MTLLVVDDDVSFNELLSQFLIREGFHVISSYRSTHALDALNSEKPDLVLVDYKLPEMDGLELTRQIKNKYPGLPVVLITSHADLRIAVRSIKLGAFEFVTKPIIPDELLKIIRLALSTSDGAEIKPPLRLTASEETDYVIGENPLTLQLWNHLQMVAPTRMNVLIYGESGTGKEHIARTIHQLSHRKDKPFVAVDCGSLSPELAASELFGHVKGSFTGAASDKTGVFESANTGTLFLDELGNLPYDIQMLLLRAMQEGIIKKVGSNKEIKVDVRIVAATNDVLSDRINGNTFRNDLYHRLNEFELRVPPLRERLDDLDAYCALFMTQAAAELNKPELPTSTAVRNLFMSYRWPGNLRELRNTIRRALLLSTGKEITPELLSPAITEDVEINATIDQALHSSQSNESSATDPLRQSEKEIIEEALRKHKYNKTKVAIALNIDRSTLYNKIRYYNIET